MAETDEVKAFFEGWRLYQAVIAHNYMRHNEIIASLSQWVNAHFKSGGIRILELGCGDAHTMVQALSKTMVTRVNYVGIDLSEMALEYARKGLQRDARVTFELISGDMLERVSEVSGSFDLVLAGFSIHHLQYPEKQALFAKLREKIGSDGTVVVYDEMMEPEEAREVFLNRAVDLFAANWKRLTPDQHEAVRNHVLIQDYPESLRGWRAIGVSAGFLPAQCLFRDPDNLYAMLVFNLDSGVTFSGQ